ncbi:MAG: hypothetical protein IKN81_08440 [Oscillospiraceae bacterium]|nr:hypothetical protein [Oscillospiraceae bacterium]
MKKTHWMLLVLFGAASTLLRVWQNRTGFEETGLAVRGNLPGLLLCAALALAAVCFVLTSRGLPTQRDVAGGLADCFRFRRMIAVTCAVAGTFLTFAGAASTVLGYARINNLLLAVFAIAAAASMLYATFALYRGGEPQSLAMLVPVCCLAVYLVALYRADAADPVLMHTYVELLATVGLTFTALERAAFSYRNGAPRIYLPASAMTVILSLAAAVDCRSVTSVLLFSGCAMIELGFLAAADFNQ